MSAAGIQWVEQTASTNDDILQRMATGSLHGTTLCARHQTAGRGRVGRSWIAPAGATLSMSIGIRHPALGRQMPFISLAAGCAIATCLNDAFGLNVGIKWPNDIHVGDRKLAGILCEAVSTGNRLTAAVIGIGLNVNLAPADLPAPLDATATSLATECNRTFETEQIAVLIRQHVLTAIDDLIDDGPSAMLSTLRTHDVAFGRRVTFDDGRGSGTAAGIADNGGLLVTTDAGESIILTAGEVGFLPPPTQ
jgi:BirA family biotin operon repressor/biotin-[acetyl-CoA-carboxylase] ligase